LLEINKANGNFNAYTAFEETNFHFSATNHQFLKVLQIWSRFFIDPLLDPKSQDDEINAVQSEFDISTSNSY
jgi:insulysin